MVPHTRQTDMEPQSRSAPGKRHLLHRAAALAVVGGFGAAAVVWILHSPQHEPTPSSERDSTEGTGAAVAQPDLPVQITNAAPHLPAPGKSSVARQAGVTNHPVPIIPRRAPTPLTRQLLASLCPLDQPGIPQTDEQLFEWKQTFEQLIKQGAEAVPAIQEFLEKNVDLGFGPETSQILGYGSARVAMLDGLLQINGPEAVSAMVEVLQNT